ncbi:MAG: hypothetical protein PHX18_00705 [Candidatus Gastranaerophilales bacterium]|nr:hypothetical protein [Candidatus Gastranaerophilales bacterium]
MKEILKKAKTLNNMFDFILNAVKSDKTTTKKNIHYFLSEMNKLSTEIEHDLT